MSAVPHTSGFLFCFAVFFLLLLYNGYLWLIQILFFASTKKIHKRRIEFLCKFMFPWSIPLKDLEFSILIEVHDIKEWWFLQFLNIDDKAQSLSIHFPPGTLALALETKTLTSNEYRTIFELKTPYVFHYYDIFHH